jgi:hypothetical protein
MSIPDWYTLLLLALASWRTFKLLSEDTILDRSRAWLLGYSGWSEGQKLPSTYRVKLGEFVACSFCFGFWISLAWWGAWQIWPHGTTVAAVPLAVSALVVFASSVFASD